MPNRNLITPHSPQNAAPGSSEHAANAESSGSDVEPLPVSKHDTSRDDLSVRGTSPAIDAPAVAKHSGSKKTVPLPESFGGGRYRVERLLGRGGMGTVYLAVDTRLNRPVAVKVPKLDDLAPELAAKSIKRFQREAQAAAALAHPNLCMVFDVGEEDGVPWLAMEFIDGESLSEQMSRLWPLRAAAELIAKVAEGVSVAHAKGIVHRDLKPANIMLDARGEPKVMDFGLAKRVDDDKLTRTGALLGTPQYMPKEQVLGETHKIGAWSDVYSLGVILYELLTARLPFDGHTVPQLLGRLLSTEAIPPRAIRPDIDLALEAICRKAIGKEIADRYDNMTQFATALREYLGETSTTPPTPPPGLPRRFPRSVATNVFENDVADPRTDAAIAAVAAERGNHPDKQGGDTMPPAAAPIPFVTEPTELPANANFCPWCQQEFPVRRWMPGDLVKCPQCRTDLQVAPDFTRFVVTKTLAPDLFASPPVSIAESVPDRANVGHVSNVPNDTRAKRTTAPDKSPRGRNSVAREADVRQPIGQWLNQNRQVVAISSVLVIVAFAGLWPFLRGANSIKPTEPATPVAAQTPDEPKAVTTVEPPATEPDAPPKFDHATLDKLIAILSDPTKRQRERELAAEQIGQFGPQSAPAVPALADALSKSELQFGIGRACVKALGQIGPPAIAAVVTVLDAETTHPDTEVRALATNAVENILFGDDSVRVLLTHLQHEDSRVRDLVMARFEKRGSERVPALLLELSDGPSIVRKAALSVLSRINALNAPAVPALVAVLKDDDGNVRRSAADALVKVGNAAVPALLAEVKDGNGVGRQAALSVLVQLNLLDELAVPALVAALTDTDAAIRLSMVDALRKIGTDAKAAIPALTEISKNDADGNLRILAADAVAIISGVSIINKIGMKLVLIPAGEFEMGSKIGSSFERPVHRVRISKPFFMGQTEVTVGQFRRFVEDAGDPTSGGWKNPFSNFKPDDNHPVVYVSWDDAQKFCVWLTKKDGRTYRLPTEAEWEYACRAGTTTAYESGDDSTSLSKVANVSGRGDGFEYTAPVGSFAANGFGLFDMHGNVWEWCEDWYDENAYKNRSGVTVDPLVSQRGAIRVARGGGWYFSPLSARAAFRSGSAPDFRYFSLGFRVLAVQSEADKSGNK